MADAAALPDYPADTYFGGKAPHRDAQLLAIARQVGADEAATSIRERVLTQIRMWAEVDGGTQRDAFCFTYDETNHGVVGLTPSFGSDEFNDHHFHYGYFLYAAGTLAATDAELAEELAPVLDALAADIACDAATEAVPVRRVFDAYASHSWASGTSPFADGNNQESSSEATTAWAGSAAPVGAGPRQRPPRVPGGLVAGPRVAGGPHLLDRLRRLGSRLRGLRALGDPPAVRRQARLRHVVLPRARRGPGDPRDPHVPEL